MKDIMTTNYKQSQNKKELILMRGLPGSGKSFLAKQLSGKNGSIFSTDDYFTDSQGKYNWDPEKIEIAHQWNNERIKKAIEQGMPTVILDNTNVSRWELRQLKPLVEYAESQGYEVRIEEPKTPWAFDPEELTKRNTHGLSLEVIQSKLRKWHPNPTIEDIKNDFNPPEMAQ